MSLETFFFFFKSLSFNGKNDATLIFSEVYQLMKPRFFFFSFKRKQKSFNDLHFDEIKL